MTKVPVNKKELLVKLKENRAIHEKEYNDLHEAYIDAVIEGLEARLKEAKKRPEDPKTRVDATKPTSYVSDYDLIIGMLEMSVDDEFMITQDEYRNYVLNEWNWTRQFELLKTSYGR